MALWEGHCSSGTWEGGEQSSTYCRRVLVLASTDVRKPQQKGGTGIGWWQFQTISQVSSSLFEFVLELALHQARIGQEFGDYPCAPRSFGTCHSMSQLHRMAQIKRKWANSNFWTVCLFKHRSISESHLSHARTSTTWYCCTRAVWGKQHQCVDQYAAAANTSNWQNHPSHSSGEAGKLKGKDGMLAPMAPMAPGQRLVTRSIWLFSWQNLTKLDHYWASIKP